jgi:hypothetical protein
MISIEISSETAEDEETEALREELDFDGIRESVSGLKTIVNTYGPFKEVRVKNDETVKGEFARTYDDKHGWICDELESVNPKNVWTLFHDPINGYSYIVAGYFTNAKGERYRNEIQSWFIADRPFEEAELPASSDSHLIERATKARAAGDFFSLSTEFIIEVNYADDDNPSYRRLDLWELIKIDDVSDEEILGCLVNCGHWF